MIGRRALFATCLLAGGFPLAPAAAAVGAASDQEAADAADGVRVFLPEAFARFAPRTALDMLRQVPGFAIQSQSQERGLGQASGNVLVNGQRPSGKSNDATAELGRIPAAAVVRIEIVDGATLNIAGLSGQVANVVIRTTGLTGQFQWRGEARARNTRPLFTAGSASVSGATGPLSYTVGIRNDAFRQGNAGPALIYGADGELLDVRIERALYSGDRPRLSAGLNYAPEGGLVANLNGSYQLYWYDQLETSERSGAGLPDRSRRLTVEQNRRSYELGGDLEFGLASGRMKLIGLRRQEHAPSDTRLVTAYADGAPSAGSRFVRTADETETVARAEYRWRGGGNDWQLSGEAAFNGLDNVAALFVLQPSGSFTEVPFPGGTARVAEQRYEAAVSWSSQLSAALSLQASVGGEFSRLSQSAAPGEARGFYRPKGFLAAAWRASPRLNLSARIERRVGQLNFSDFLASENLGRGSGDAANPDLVPPQSWDAEIEGSRSFGPWGTTTVRLYSRLIADIIDQIAIGPDAESPGNLPWARVAGIDWRATLQGAPLGWAGARLDARVQLQTSALEDPLTGAPRRIGNDLVRFVELNLRHDVARTDWAWGGQLSHARRSASVRLGEISYGYDMSPLLATLFVEHKDVFGLTVRGAVRNLLGADDYLDRTVWVGRRGGAVAFVESRNRTVGPIFAATVSGTF